LVWRPPLPWDRRDTGNVEEQRYARTCWWKLRARDSYPPGKQIVFVTNNSTKSRADYKKKLEKLGIPSTTVRLSESLRRLGQSRGRVHRAKLTEENRKKSFRPRTAHQFIFRVSSNCQRISERFSSSESQGLSRSFNRRMFHSSEAPIPRIGAK
jgi:hypothetical protein